MSRAARIKSETNTYHVMLRGIDRSQLFYDDEDRNAFIERLSRYKKECGFSLLAWCLMGNHVHLLIQEQDGDLPVLMKKLTLSYSHYFNKKYERCGYLFQDRYKSKPVESDEYLLAVVRYILQNPLEAGLPMTAWTSYTDYLSSSILTDTDLVLGMFATDEHKARKAFKEFVEAPASESDSAYEHLGSKGNSGSRIYDAEAIRIILETSGLADCQSLAAVDKDERNRVLVALRQKHLSIRQIARLTGIGRHIVATASVKA